MKLLKRISLAILVLLLLSMGLCYGQDDFINNRDTVWELIQKGLDYGSQGNFKEAGVLFEKANELYKKTGSVIIWDSSRSAKHLRIIEYANQKKIKPDLAVHYFRAICKLEWVSTQWERAIDYFDKIIEQDPGDSGAYFIRGHIYHYYGGRKLAGDKAIIDFSKTIELSPEFYDAYLMRGMVYHSKGMTDNAIFDFSKAIEMHPGQAEYYFFRGRAYNLKQDYDKAITDFSKVIDLKNNHVESYLRRGKSYFLKGEYRNAISDYGKAFEINPDSFDDWSGSNMTISLPLMFRDYQYRSREYERAVSDFKKTGMMKLEKDEEYFARGIVYCTIEEYDKAISDYSRAIELNPENYRYYLERGITYNYRVEKYDEAISDYSRTMEVKPEKAGGLYILQGDAYLKKGEPDNAIFTYNKAMEQGTLCYEQRGDAYFEKSEYEKAIADYNRHIEQNPNILINKLLETDNAYFKRGNAYFKIAKYKDAISDYKKLIETNPKNPTFQIIPIYIKRGDTYDEMGDLKNACSDWIKARDLGDMSRWSIINRIRCLGK
ncbi:tetratricopeptide repeat protein [Thermodesulfobacteriota bacterium]